MSELNISIAVKNLASVLKKYNYKIDAESLINLLHRVRPHAEDWEINYSLSLEEIPDSIPEEYKGSYVTSIERALNKVEIEIKKCEQDFNLIYTMAVSKHLTNALKEKLSTIKERKEYLIDKKLDLEADCESIREYFEREAQNYDEILEYLLYAPNGDYLKKQKQIEELSLETKEVVGQEKGLSKDVKKLDSSIELIEDITRLKYYDSKQNKHVYRTNYQNNVQTMTDKLHLEQTK